VIFIQQRGRLPSGLVATDSALHCRKTEISLQC